MPHTNTLNRVQGRQKSNFPALTTIPSDATFDFVSSGTNFKITLPDFLAGLGVTGTIVQDGNALATPVLDTQGTVHNIRNLEDGSGITTSVSAENGITIEHNFQLDVTGSALSADFTADSPTFRSIAGGAGITVSAAGDVITVAQTGGAAQQIAVVTGTYQTLPADDIVNASGTFTVTLPAAASFIHEVTITCISGSISLAADTTINNSSPITAVSSATFYIAGTTWWRK